MSAFRISQRETPKEPGPQATSRHRLPAVIQRASFLVRVDFPADRELPQPIRLAVATVISIVGSLVVDAFLVAIGLALFPSTKGYVHFRFSDYGKLTIVGVVLACVSWPIVTWISSTPRWLLFRLAVLVTLFLWLPDLFILAQGQAPKAVGVLIVMHLAIALVTYNALVHVAPATVRFGRPDNPSRL